MTPEFDKCWESLGLVDKQLKDLQESILLNPKLGAVIQGTGGLRKVRYATNNKGKSGSIRVLYVDLVIHQEIYLLSAYPKSKKDNLTASEKNNVKKLIEELKKVDNERRN